MIYHILTPSSGTE